jgi:D-amino peptidase
MKYFISADIEGVAGILNWGETDKDKNDDYGFFCDLMTKETLAVVEGINSVDRDAQIIIKDAHDSGRNLYIDQFPDNVQIIRGWDEGPYCMFQGLDESYSGVFCVGYHSESTSHGNPLSHTISSGRILEVRINGKAVNEFEIHSLIAAHHKVPALLVTGDKMLTEKIHQINPNIGIVATKEGIGDSVMTKTPEKVRTEILEVVKRVVSDPEKEKYLIENPENFELEVSYKHFKHAYMHQFFPGCRLKDNLTVTFETDDYYEIMRTLMYIL